MMAVAGSIALGALYVAVLIIACMASEIAADLIAVAIKRRSSK